MIPHTSLLRWQLLIGECKITPNSFIDEFWKETNLFSGLGWVCLQNETNGQLLEAKNVNKFLSLLHSKLENLIWAMTCLLDQRQNRMAFTMYCSKLVKMMTTPAERPTFSMHLKELTKLKFLISSFSLSSVFRNLNTKINNLAQSVRKYMCNIIYVNLFLRFRLPNRFNN